MPKRAGRWEQGWAVGLCCVAALWACGSGESKGADEETATPAGEAPRRVSGADGDEVRYQIVETSDGMTVEAVAPTQVQTFSCPVSSCSGICDECAARACQGVGELSEACERLSRDCNSSCTCNGSEFSPGSCGFPVCSTNRNLCYEGNEPVLPPTPDPEPDPSPISPGGAADGPSSAPNGSGAARPAG